MKRSFDFISFPLRQTLHKYLVRKAGRAIRHEDWLVASCYCHLLSWIDARPEPDLYLYWARSYQGQRKYRMALSVLEAGLKVFPDYVPLLTEVAIIENYYPQHHRKREDYNAGIDSAEVDIIICVHDAYDDVIQCLNSIQRHTSIPFRIIVIDDASGSKLGKYLEKYDQEHSNFCILRNDKNLGYTRSANRGLRFSKNEWVVLINSDTIVTNGWLEGLLSCAITDHNVRAVGPLSNAATIQSVPRMWNDSGEFIVNQLPEGCSPDNMNQLIRSYSQGESYCVPVLNGFCTLFHRPTIESLGYLNEERFPYGYGEENDLCLRLSRRGYRLVISSIVYVYHKKSASFGHQSRKEFTADGVAQLKTLWPGYSYRYIAERVADIPGLQSLRAKLLKMV